MRKCANQTTKRGRRGGRLRLCEGLVYWGSRGSGGDPAARLQNEYKGRNWGEEQGRV